MTNPTPTVSALVNRRRRIAGAAPLLTYYDLGTGERTELSGTTFATWVDKTANLLLDADVQPGDPVELSLLTAHPGHWVSAVWAAAVWQLGATVVLDGADAEPVLRVVGPEDVAAVDASPYEPVVACSLHPMGFGFGTDLPPDVTDYVDVRTFPDAFLGVPYSGTPAVDAWRHDGRAVGQAALIADVLDADERRLVTPTPDADPLAVLVQVLVRPLAGLGSSVVVVGAVAPDRLARIAASERAA